MSFRSCRREDPFTRTVRNTFHCNVVRAPRAGITPLDVLAFRKPRLHARGRLASMLGMDPSIEIVPTRSNPAASLSGSRSTDLELGLGLALTSTFLTALGVPAPGASVDLTLWKGTHSVAFEVRDVIQRDVDIAQLGVRLVGARIASSPASVIFFDDRDVQMLVITRTLTSNRFAIRCTSGAGQTAKVSVDAIEHLVGKTHGSVTWSHESDDVVTFTGQEPLAFAFAAVPCVLHSDGSFYFGLEADGLTLGDPQTAVTEGRPLVDEDGLLDFDTA